MDRVDAGAHAASLPQSSTPRFSARASGSMPAAENASGATTPASDCRSILRRWAKPARTSSKSRAAGTAAGSTATVARRSIRTSTDSTAGRGTNTDAGTRPTTRAVAWYATFTDTAPYALSSGPAASRSPTSRWTMTSIDCTLGASSRARSTTGTATL